MSLRSAGLRPSATGRASALVVDQQRNGLARALAVRAVAGGRAARVLHQLEEILQQIAQVAAGRRVAARAAGVRAAGGAARAAGVRARATRGAAVGAARAVREAEQHLQDIGAARAAAPARIAGTARTARTSGASRTTRPAGAARSTGAARSPLREGVREHVLQLRRLVAGELSALHLGLDQI